MLPPDRNMFKTEAKPPPPELSNLEKLIRYAEKNDLLLYITAFFGVFMPALVYFIYKRAHLMYKNYSAVSFLVVQKYQFNFKNKIRKKSKNLEQEKTRAH